MSEDSEIVPCDSGSGTKSQISEKTVNNELDNSSNGRKRQLESNESIPDGSENLPSQSEGLDSSSSESEVPFKHCRRSKVRKGDNTKANASLNKSDSEKDAESSSEEEVYIQPSRGYQADMRIYDKVQSCYFCNKKLLKMARHLELCHKKEPEVAKIIVLKKGSSERREGFNKLIRLGNFYHNSEVLSTGKGELILLRRPSENEHHKLNPNNYGPCPDCLGFIEKKYLWLHSRRCKYRNKGKKESFKRNIKAESSSLIITAVSRKTTSAFRKDILSYLVNDDITEVVIRDELICQFGMLMNEKYGSNQKDYVRQSMRIIARLVLQIREEPRFQKCTLTNILKPDMFETILKAVNVLCLQQSTQTSKSEFKNPSLALKLGNNIKKCASIVRGKALLAKDTVVENEMKAFLDLLELKWRSQVSSQALSSIVPKKTNKLLILPLTSDLIKLITYQTSEILKLTNELNKNPSKEVWYNLSLLTLSRITLFNKRRGDISRMLITQYATRPDWRTSTEELHNSLTDLEQQLCSRLTLVEVSGKGEKTVPVLLTPDSKKAVDVLIVKRGKIGVNQMNPYVFARVNDSSTDHLRGCDALKYVAEKVQLTNFSLIASTSLRKYIATVTQVFNLTENEIDWLAWHLGYDARVHTEFYRLHESAAELSKVSQILMAVDRGEVNKYAGKPLSNINVNEIDVSDEEDFSSGNGSSNIHGRDEANTINTSTDVLSNEKEHQRSWNEDVCKDSNNSQHQNCLADGSIVMNEPTTTSGAMYVTTTTGAMYVTTPQKRIPWSTEETSAVFVNL